VWPYGLGLGVGLAVDVIVLIVSYWEDTYVVEVVNAARNADVRLPVF